MKHVKPSSVSMIVGFSSSSDKAIHRLVNKGALHPKKISGRLCFDRVELDRVLANGDHKRGRGRPRK